LKIGKGAKGIEHGQFDIKILNCLEARSLIKRRKNKELRQKIEQWTLVIRIKGASARNQKKINETN